MIDLTTIIYACYAVSIKPKKDGYMKAYGTIAKIRIDPESIKLHRYYSGQRIPDDFSKNTRTFIIIKKNSSVSGSIRWREIVRRNMLKLYANKIIDN